MKIQPRCEHKPRCHDSAGYVAATLKGKIAGVYCRRHLKVPKGFRAVTIREFRIRYGLTQVLS